MSLTPSEPKAQWRYPYFIGNAFFGEGSKIVIGVWEYSDSAEAWHLVGQEPMPESIRNELSEIAARIDSLTKGKY